VTSFYPPQASGVGKKANIVEEAKAGQWKEESHVEPCIEKRIMREGGVDFSSHSENTYRNYS
jgi:hypothetical protein